MRHDATGRGPTSTASGTLRLNEGDQLPVTGRMRKVKALWNILSDTGRKVAVVGWWATWPSEKVNGAMVSDHFAYHFLFGQGLRGDPNPEGKTSPPELVDRLRPLVKRPQDLTLADVGPFVSVSQQDFDRPFDLDDELSGFKWALSTTMTYRNVGLELWNKDRPDNLFTYFEATDSTAHLFGHLFRASNLRNRGQQATARPEAMYAYADRPWATHGGHGRRHDPDRPVRPAGSALPDDPSKLRSMRRSERFH